MPDRAACPEPNPFPELRAELRPLLAAYAGGLRRCFGGDLSGVYVCGSLALGAYLPAGSDVDVTVLLRVGPTPAQRRDLAALHAGPAGTLPGAGRLDVSFVPLRLAGGGGDPGLPYFRDGRYHDVGGGDVSPVLWHILRERGIAVWGPPAATVVPAVSAGALAASMRRNVDFLRHRMPYYIAGGTATQAFGVLSLCRTLYTLGTGEVTSKLAAAAWAGKRVGRPWRPLVARAAGRYARTDYGADLLLAAGALHFAGYVRAIAPRVARRGR